MTGQIDVIDEITGRDGNDSTVLTITELPVGKWTTDYKQYLEAIVIGGPGPAEGEKGMVPMIKDFKENHTDTTVLFTVSMPSDKFHEASRDGNPDLIQFNPHLSQLQRDIVTPGIEKKFKLESSVNTTNMHAFDCNHLIKK